MKCIFNKNRLILALLVMLFHISTAQIKTIDGKSVILKKDMDSFLQEQIQALHIPSLSIAFINNGKIVYHRALGYADLEKKEKADDHTVYEAASISKVVFGYFVMRMVDRGVLSLDTPLYKYYPYPDIAYDPRYKLFTARMVLDHTTGLPNWHEFQPPPDSVHVPKGAQYIMFQPGTKWSYSGEAYQYLVRVIAHLLHTDEVSLCDTACKEINVPLGMKHASFGWNNYIRDHRATGYVYNADSAKYQRGQLKKFEEFSAAGGLRTDAVDYARFLIGMVNGTGLSPQAHKEMLKPQSVVTDTGTIRRAGAHWGLGVAIKETPYGIRYWHNGSNGDYTSDFEIFKDSKSGVVMLCNDDRIFGLWGRVLAYYREGKRFKFPQTATK